jgi:colicin import membrane protein
MMSATLYSVPREPGNWRAITLAVIVHAMLFTFLWVGIRWQNDTPQTIEAEVWSPQVQEAAPPPPPSPPAPTPEVKQPAPEVKEVPPVEKPDIALEQEKKKRAEEKKALEDEKRAEKLQAEKEKKLADEQKRKQDALDAKKLEAQRKAELKRIAGDISATGTEGSAVRTSGPRGDASWSQRVAAKIKSNTHFLGTSDSNDPVEFDVRLLPDGSVAGVRKVKSSGIPEFDEAVRRAIDLSQPFPADSSGRVPPNLPISHRPKDQ